MLQGHSSHDRDKKHMTRDGQAPPTYGCTCAIQSHEKCKFEERKGKVDALDMQAFFQTLVTFPSPYTLQFLAQEPLLGERSVDKVEKMSNMFSPLNFA